jgi:hypothetical protein
MRTEVLRASGTTFAVAAFLSGCSSGPSRPFIMSSAQAVLDQDVMCVLWPGDRWKRRGETFFVFEQDRASLDPFLTAGLVKMVSEPDVRKGTAGQATWFELSAIGSERAVKCLVDAAQYPNRYEMGFRVGRREAEAIASKGKVTKLKCASTSWADVKYRLLVDAEWFDPNRFKTNFSTFSFDPTTRTGTVLVPFHSGDGRRWGHGELFGPHSNFVCF